MFSEKTLKTIRSKLYAVREIESDLPFVTDKAEREELEFKLFQLLEYLTFFCLQDIAIGEANEEYYNIKESLNDIYENMPQKGKKLFCSYKKSIDVQEYLFVKKGNVIKLSLPPLLSRRAASKTLYFPVKSRYICNIAEWLLESHKSEIDMFAECTILIVSFQNADAKIIRDNDNTDAHDLINIINKYCISTDDNGSRVSVVYDTKLTDSYNKTEVFILPKLSFENYIF